LAGINTILYDFW